MSTESAVQPEGKEQTVDAATPAPKVTHLTASERVARGKAAREETYRVQVIRRSRLRQIATRWR